MDYTQRYERISRPFRTAGATRALNAVDRALVYVFAVAYIVLLALLAIQGDARIVRAVIVPAITFALVSALRLAINRPRPYEACAIDPLVEKDTHGKSMPSRHMASAVVIACTFLWVCPAAGIALLAGCACIALTRVIGGVHYPSDIAAAAAIGLACAAIGYLL